MSRFYFPLVPWLVERHRAAARKIRVETHAALFASKRLARLRGRHHKQIQQDMLRGLSSGAHVIAAEQLFAGVTAALFVLPIFYSPVVVVAEVADASWNELGWAMTLVAGTWLAAAVVLVPILARGGIWAQLAAFLAAVVIASAAVAAFGAHMSISTTAQAAGFGLFLYLMALVGGLNSASANAATGRERALWLLVPLFFFAPFLTARLLMGPDYPVWTTTWAALMAVGVTVVVTLLVLGVFWLVKPTSKRAVMATTLLALTALLTTITFVPRDEHWALRAVHGGLLVPAWGLLAFVTMAVVYGVFLTVYVNRFIALDPESEVVRGLLLLALDLEFGSRWRLRSLPERADDRTSRRWLRRVLVSNREPVELDRPLVRRLTDRCDSLIWLLDRHFSSHFRVRHEETNEFVRQRARSMAATVALWQRRMLIRDGKAPGVVVDQVIRCLDAAVSRQWDRFEVTEVDGASVPLRRRFMTITKQAAVAVLPLAAVGVLTLSPLVVPTSLVGSLVTFALTWLAANLIRAIDPRAGGSLEIADKLARMGRGQ